MAPAGRVMVAVEERPRVPAGQGVACCFVGSHSGHRNTMSTSSGRRDHDDDGRRVHGDNRVHDGDRTVPVPAQEGRYVDDRPTAHERFGGVKFGSAFFGWLCAMGMAVLLTAIAAAAGTAVGLNTGTDAGEAAEQAAQDPQTIGIVGAVVVAGILFVSYYCGGYVAGRMARFDGARQGIAVWVWALLVAIILGVVAAVAGSEYDVLGRLNGFPRLPVGTDELTTAGVVALVLALLTSLIGAILGGLAGMRFHRKVDRAMDV
jgi:hypothetical protein